MTGTKSSASKLVSSYDWQVHAGCWQEGLSSLPHESSPRGCLRVLNTAAGFLQSTQSKRNQGRDGSVSYALSLEVIHQHYCHILLVPHSNLDAFWVVTSQVHEYPEVRITGGPLGGWLQYIIFFETKIPHYQEDNLEFSKICLPFRGQFIHSFNNWLKVF